MLVSTKTYKTEYNIIYIIRTMNEEITKKVICYDVQIVDSKNIQLLNTEIKPQITGDILDKNEFHYVIDKLIPGGTYIVTPEAKGIIFLDANIQNLTSNTFYISGYLTLFIAGPTFGSATLDIDGGYVALMSTNIVDADGKNRINIDRGGYLLMGYNQKRLLKNMEINFGKGRGTVVINCGGKADDLSSLEINHYNPNLHVIGLQNIISEVSKYAISGGRFTKKITLLDEQNRIIFRYRVKLAERAYLKSGVYDIENDGPLYVMYYKGHLQIGRHYLPHSTMATTY
ncbi:hypothetical protein [Commensalibacter oyaizuii]|uniref:Auto-transporter adhesin head GIN domain-containing protein n=1 Tax=Commensalibacter oyaizuii TaxID=3043873 RepID=A0ABT6PYL3_9PROT|nr:hypothetical protein [Commensalibacter sp. TBRC 16381]MDI2089808.1 hypothetical protein [Commensalibacter sp. TBRC 16381]